MIGENTDLDVFVEIYQPLQDAGTEALIKNIKFYDAMCRIKDKDAETIAETLATRYEDLGVDLEYILTERFQSNLLI